MELERITPTKAKEYLALNTNNRSFQQNTASLYARLMKNGDWLLNGDTIRFNVHGDLVDGQHRLAAVVEAKVPLSTYVVRNLPIEAQLTLDQQRKRSAGDMLKMYGISDGNRMAAIVRMVHRWRNGDRGMYGFSSGGTMLSAKEVVDIVEVDEDGVYIEATKRSGLASMRILAPSRAIGTMIVLMEEADAGKAKEFFDQIESGAGLEEGDPVLTLRRYWLRLSTKDQHRNVASPVYLMAGVRAWDAFLEGRVLTQIGYKSATIPEIKTLKDIKDNPSTDAEIEADNPSGELRAV
jgi:hypothetical protein